MKKAYLHYSFISILIICVSALFISCDTWPGGEEDVADAVAAISGSISLKLSQTSVKSDDSDSTTITATVLDTNKAIMEGAKVTFSATGGELSASSVDTDANGESQVTFSSGTTDKSNRVVTITATVAGVDPRQIPLQIQGTTITLSADSTNLEIGGADTATLTISVKDAAPVGIYAAPVTVSVDPASTGAATLSPSSGNTDVNGELEVDVTGTGSGSVTVTVESVGATATQTYTVGAAGAVFGISSPTTDPYSLSTDTDLPITVNAPDQTGVQFATTLGAWDGGAEMVVTKDVSSGSASAILRSANAGVATVQVLDSDNSSTTDSLKVAISAPSSEASQIALQASATVVAPSIGDTSNTITLTATVKNDSDEPVGDSPVAFSIENPTGGGETISPAIGYTNDYGIATSTFTSGSLSSGAWGVTAKASVVGMLAVVTPDTIDIVIGGTAASVVLGVSTEISSNSTDTAYILPMSVLVADSNGNPVSGASVSLSTWPTSYRTGNWSEEGAVVLVAYHDGGPSQYDNEDTNKNLILDGVEDTGPDPVTGRTNPGHGDGDLTPPSSASGTVPGTVTTDENGVANFDLVYLKQYSVWVEAKIKASTLVLGTETTSTLTFWLPYAIGEEASLPSSPFNWY